MKKVLFLFLLLTSCGNKDEIVEYYQNGAIKSVYMLKNGFREGDSKDYDSLGNLQLKSEWANNQLHGVQTEYFQNGRVKALYNWMDGVKHGSYVLFAKTGSIIQTGEYYEGLLCGYQNRFEDGMLMQSRHYVLVNDSDYLNQFFVFDGFGNIKYERSLYYSIAYQERHDTVLKNKEVSMKLIMQNLNVGVDGSSEVKIVLGNFDGRFRLLEKTSLDTIKVNGLIKDLKFSFNNTGHQFKRGMILNVFKDELGKNDTIKLFFEKHFFVIGD
ncbi:MAG: hypothetical protein QM786_13075 [Breznakibacter sp.]